MPSTRSRIFPHKKVFSARFAPSAVNSESNSPTPHPQIFCLRGDQSGLEPASLSRLEHLGANGSAAAAIVSEIRRLGVLVEA